MSPVPVSLEWDCLAVLALSPFTTGCGTMGGRYLAFLVHRSLNQNEPVPSSLMKGILGVMQKSWALSSRQCLEGTLYCLPRGEWVLSVGDRGYGICGGQKGRLWEIILLVTHAAAP